jgi:hypothetical protein
MYLMYVRTVRIYVGTENLQSIILSVYTVYILVDGVAR